MHGPAISSNEAAELPSEEPPFMSFKSMEFTNLNFGVYRHIKVPHRLIWERKLQRQIFSDVCGIFRAKTLTAIIGPSGCVRFLRDMLHATF
jgi:hypothetical protein